MTIDKGVTNISIGYLFYWSAIKPNVKVDMKIDFSEIFFYNNNVCILSKFVLIN